MSNNKINKKDIIIISAINLRSGGSLTILRNCLNFLSGSPISKNYRIIALVHNKNLCNFPNIEYLEFPKSIKSYFLRIYYEYFYFKKLSKKLNPYLWLSLHDITPSVKAERRAVYMHNPSVFNKLKISDLKFDKTYILFSLFYKYLYKINIKKNKFCIVQQKWLKGALSEKLKIDETKFIVAKPEDQTKNIENISFNIQFKRKNYVNFFFPSLPRPFKNFETVCEAAKIIYENRIKDIKIFLTIDGSENSYSKYIYNKYKQIPNIKFTGLIPSEEMNDWYSKMDVLIFPSRLETWGLPISEFKATGKPMILADLPYAKETAEGANHVAYFNPNDAKKLANLIIELYSHNVYHFSSQPVADDNMNNIISGYEDLFKTLLS